MTLPDSSNSPEEIAYWRGRVDASLISLDIRMKNIEIIVDTLPERIETRMEKMIGELEKTITASNSRRITFQWVMEKIALPLLLSGGSAGLAVYAIMKSTGLH